MPVKLTAVAWASSTTPTYVLAAVVCAALRASVFTLTGAFSLVCCLGVHASSAVVATSAMIDNVLISVGVEKKLYRNKSAAKVGKKKERAAICSTLFLF
jgi:hypothetical protein